MSARLSEITSSLGKCQHCSDRFAATKTAHRPNPIFQMSSKARLCIAGQAPGLRAHNASRPFDDPSGVRLRHWLGLDETVFYDPDKLAIIPMAFCFPGYNRANSDLPPPPDCARLWRKQIFEALPRIELVVLVGKSALAWHIPTLKSKSLTEIVGGGLIEGVPALLPLPHPSWRNNSWLKQNPWFEADILPVLRSEVSRLAS